MTGERHIGSKRAQAMRFVLFTQRVSRALSHDKDDRVSADMLMQLAEAIRMRMGASACSFEDIMRAIDGARATGYLREDELPNEKTPAESPRAKDRDAQDAGTWREWVRNQFGWRL